MGCNERYAGVQGLCRQHMLNTDILRKRKGLQVCERRINCNRLKTLLGHYIHTFFIH